MAQYSRLPRVADTAERGARIRQSLIDGGVLIPHGARPLATPLCNHDRPVLRLDDWGKSGRPRWQHHHRPPQWPRERLSKEQVKREQSLAQRERAAAARRIPNE